MPERNRDWVWGAVALVVLIAIVLVLAPPPRQVAGDRRLTTMRTTPDGAGALFATLQELGLPVARRMTPLAGVEPIRGPLAILAPTEMPTPVELDSLVAWVERGGRLIVASPYGPVSDRLELATWLAGTDVPLEPVPGHPWTDGLGPLTGEAPGAGPLVPGFRLLRRDTLRGPELRPLVVEPEEGDPAVALLERGRGEILVIADGSLVSNGAIRAGGLAPLVARAFADWTAGGDTVRFDEYHHGHRGGSPYRAFGSFLAREGVGRAALQLAIVALLALVPFAVRLGSPISPAPASRRSRLEHAAALGEVYRGARAEPVARRRLLAGFARRIGRDRPSPGGEEEFLERLERSVVTGAEAVAAVAEAWRERRPVAELARRIDGAVERLNPRERAVARRELDRTVAGGRWTS